jgi:hypothetical protein
MKNDPLFELIKSLKQTEKSYFKKMAVSHKKNSDNNFLVLFNLIEKQKKYNEKKIKSILGDKHFAQKKKHLYEKVMESLRQYNAKNNHLSLINTSLTDYNILLSKSMLELADKSLEKARILSLKSESYYDLLKVLNLKIELLKNKNNVQEIEIHIEKYKTSVKKVNQLIVDQIELEELYLSIIKWNKNIEWIRNKKEQQVFFKIFDHALLKSNIAPTSNRSKIIYYYIKAIHCYLQSSFAEALSFFQKELYVFNKEKWLKNELSAYLRCLANNCLLAIYENNDEIYNECFNELKEKIIETPLLKQLQYYYINLLQLKKLFTENKIKKAISIIDASSEAIKSIENDFFSKNIMYNEITIMSFVKIAIYLNSEQTKKALETSNYFLNNANKKLKKDSYALARILNLLIHYELKHYDLLEYELISAKKHFISNGRFLTFEKTMIKFLKDLLNTNEKKEIQSLHENLKTKLIELKKDPFEKVVLQFYDFENWSNKISII